MRPIALFLVLVLAVGALVVPPAVAAPDRREMQARQAFAAGNYHDALDLYIQLYAETLHPNYQRNIGRCYQNLRDPDKAINSFREYLRKAKGLGADERAEVDGYVAEMEELKRRQQREAAPPPPDQKQQETPTAASSTVEPRPAPPPAAPAPQSPSLVDLSAPSAPLPNGGPDEAAPIYTRWWFWAIVGGAVVTSVGVAAAAGVFTKTTDAPCMPPRICAQP